MDIPTDKEMAIEAKTCYCSHDRKFVKYARIYFKHARDHNETDLLNTAIDVYRKWVRERNTPVEVEKPIETYGNEDDDPVYGNGPLRSFT